MNMQMTARSFLLLALTLTLCPVSALAKDNHHSHGSKYGGQEKREIKSLSAYDITELRRGGGWGLAKAAELNGVPGPIHLLELKKEIALTDAQIAAITRIYDGMKAEAVKRGEKLIVLEKELESHFRNRTVTETILRRSLAAIAEARQALRFTHLAAHLRTPEILSEAQIRKYNALRGYTKADPCDAVPKGHNPAMWRKHNGCK